MSLNADKTEILCIRSKTKTKNIEIEGQSESSSIRLLGFHMFSDFSFDVHVAQVKKSVSYKLLCLRKLAPFLNLINMKKIAQSLVYSSISYCLPLFGHEQKFQKILQKLINSAARIVLKRGPRCSVSNMLQELEWPA